MATVDGSRIFGSHVVIQVGLVPNGSQQRRNTTIDFGIGQPACLGQARPIGNGLLGAKVIVLNHLHKTSLVILKEGHQAVRQLCGEVALGGITQNGAHTVVGRNDDETLRMHRKDITVGHAIVGHGGIGQFGLGRFHGGINIHKLDAQSLGPLHIDGFGLQHSCKQ